MVDPLSLLRLYVVNKKEILEHDTEITFGILRWPKNVKTNYLISGSIKDGTPKEYYTLECLLFFLKNVHLTHSEYEQQAAIENIPVVQTPNRSDLLNYLYGKKDTSVAIDKSAPVDIPKIVKRAYA